MANLIVNNDFEVNTSGWSGETNCTIAQSTLQANTGLACLAATATAAGDMQTSTLSSSVAVVEGRDYILTLACLAATVGRAVQVQINWQHGTTWLSVRNPQIFDVTTSFMSRVAFGRAPGTADHAYVGIHVVGCAAGEVHYLDTVDFHELIPGSFTSVGKPGPRVSNRTGRLQGGY